MFEKAKEQKKKICTKTKLKKNGTTKRKEREKIERKEKEYFMKEAKRCGTTPELERLRKLSRDVGIALGNRKAEFSRKQYEQYLHDEWIIPVSERDIKLLCNPYFIDFVSNAENCINKLIPSEYVLYTPRILTDTLLSYGFERFEITQAIEKCGNAFHFKMLDIAETITESVLAGCKDYTSEEKMKLVQIKLSDELFDESTIKYIVETHKHKDKGTNKQEP